MTIHALDSIEISEIAGGLIVPGLNIAASATSITFGPLLYAPAFAQHVIRRFGHNPWARSITLRHVIAAPAI